MFDLFRSRAKVVRYLLGAVLMLVAISMVVTLVPGFVGSSYSDDSNIIAEIGDEVLTVQEVQLAINQQLRNNAFPREMTGSYVPMIINEMVSDRALAYQARRMGFEVSDEELARSVQSMIPQLFQNGQFVGQQAYAQYLQGMNLTIAQFEDNVRKQILLLRLLNLALEGEIVTDVEIEEAFRETSEKIQVEYIAISPSDFRATATVSSGEIRDYFEANKSTFQIGEKRDAQILVADEAEISSTITMSDEELEKRYRSALDSYRLPERVNVRHILLKTTDKSKEEVAQIKEKAEGLLAQLKAGADFAELAKANSDDTGTAIAGGELGWITRGQTVKEFETVAFSLAPNEISDVISTEYGFHILQLVAKEPARLQPFAEVKDQIAAQARQQFVFERIEQLAEQARAELTANPSQASPIAKKLGLAIYSVEKIGASDPIPEIAGSAEMQAAIRTLPKGGVTQVYDLGNNRLGVGTVTEVHPPREATLSEVEDTIRERLRSQKAQQMIESKRQQLTAALESSGDDLGKVARTLGIAVQTTDEITRNGNVNGLGSAAFLVPAFKKPVGAILGPINAMGQTVVCKVIKKVPADMTQLASERENILTSLQRAKAQERRDLFAEGVLNELIQEGKVKINERGRERLISVYTG